MSRFPVVRLAAALLLASLTGCATPVDRDVLASRESQLKLRSMQSRAFDTGDRQTALRGVIATLQDLEFMLEGADATLGTVTARKFVWARGKMAGDLALTVSVRPRGEKQVVVRLNAEFNRKQVEDPVVYQNFFAALGRSLFLAGKEID